MQCGSVFQISMPSRLSVDTGAPWSYKCKHFAILVFVVPDQNTALLVLLSKEAVFLSV